MGINTWLAGMDWEERTKWLREKLYVGNPAIPLVLLIFIVSYLVIVGTVCDLSTFGSVQSYVHLTARGTSAYQDLLDQYHNTALTGGTIYYGGIGIHVAPSLGIGSDDAALNYVLNCYSAIIYHAGGDGNVGRAYSLIGDRAHAMYDLIWWIGVFMLCFVLGVMVANYPPAEIVRKAGYAAICAGVISMIIGFLMVTYFAPSLDTTSRILIEAYPMVVNGIRWAFVVKGVESIIIGGLLYGIGRIFGEESPK